MGREVETDKLEQTADQIRIGADKARNYCERQ